MGIIWLAARIYMLLFLDYHDHQFKSEFNRRLNEVPNLNILVGSLLVGRIPVGGSQIGDALISYHNCPFESIHNSHVVIGTSYMLSQETLAASPWKKHSQTWQLKVSQKFRILEKERTMPYCTRGYQEYLAMPLTWQKKICSLFQAKRMVPCQKVQVLCELH